MCFEQLSCPVWSLSSVFPVDALLLWRDLKNPVGILLVPSYKSFFLFTRKTEVVHKLNRKVVRGRVRDSLILLVTFFIFALYIY